MAPDWEDLTAFFETSTAAPHGFAITASWASWNGSGYDAAVDVTVIFDDETIGVDQYTGDVTNIPPQACVRVSEASDIKPKDKLTISGSSYVIYEVVPDSTGATVHLELVKQK